MKVTYKTNRLDQDDNIIPKIDIETQNEETRETLSDKFLYIYLIVCIVIIIAIKIFA
ncbi:Hypothetical protein SFBmNL_01505 [Candidatus Arthromitus sp. SFB-mouse-NL]|uniref:hypothetical protein n=1 Tax=Candidatus Arthromitus sp. SFB-mouse-NL TaxID=1508644 RepID=UPI00049B49D6|nr:hypothetical protein [Candidatus Arthromitus sp. SFB-mouse-NL]AID45404.1 Hypothetical protein SFBmNL_01505 [Candidatus Arthromitus sp. SFB-mouse-NL]